MPWKFSQGLSTAFCSFRVPNIRQPCSHGFPQHIGDFGEFYTIYTIRSNFLVRNLIAIGFEAELSLEAGDYDTGFWFHGLERLFLCIYCAEALFRAFSCLDLL